jgi:hypothetical protein
VKVYGYLDPENFGFDFGTITPAVNWLNAGGHYHEIELSRMRVVRDRGAGQSGTKTSATYVSARYEFGFAFFRKHKGARLRPSIGLALEPFVSITRVVPRHSNTVPTGAQDFGVRATVVPRLLITPFPRRWFIDLNVLLPFYLHEVALQLTQIEDPTLPRAEQNDAELTSELFDHGEVMFRVGIGVRLQ